MKPKKRLARLNARRKWYDDNVAKLPNKGAAWTRPGSLSK